MNLLKKRVILSGVPSGAKAGRNGVEGSRCFRAMSPVLARDPSTPLRPPFRLRSAQDDTSFENRMTQSPPRLSAFSRRIFAASVLGLLLVSATLVRAVEAKPNLVFILADDLGYGDVKCLNPQGKIATPNLDRLAAGGMIFTDAHSSSAVCTPTRYGILTGRYNWRSRLKSGVLGGLSPRLIEEGRMTVASFLKDRGYDTACVGKWHLGMDWVKHAGKEVSELNIEKPEQVGSVDFSKPLTNGPNSVGFGYYFGIAASLDMVPYTFIENDRVTKLPSGDAQVRDDDGSREWVHARRTGGTGIRRGGRVADADAARQLS